MEETATKKKPKINARAKGARGEKELKGLFLEQLNLHLVRNPDQTPKGGYDCSLRFDDDLDSPVALPFAFEFKRNESMTPQNMWKQAISQVTKSCYVPIVVYKRNYQGWRVVVPWCLITKELGPYCPTYEDAADIGLERFMVMAKNWLTTKK